MRFSLALAAALIASSTSLTHAHEYDVGNLHIVHPHARPTVAGQTTGAAYLTVENKGKTPDRLLAASTPLAKSVEMHTMAMEGNVMRMREVNQIEFKPEAKTVMKPGEGHHLMLMGLTQPLKAGDKFPLMLTFEKAGNTEVSVVVQDHHKKEKKEAAHHHAHH